MALELKLGRVDQLTSEKARDPRPNQTRQTRDIRACKVRRPVSATHREGLSRGDASPFNREERLLEDTSREDDLVRRRLVVRIDGRGRHVEIALLPSNLGPRAALVGDPRADDVLKERVWVLGQVDRVVPFDRSGVFGVWVLGRVANLFERAKGACQVRSDEGDNARGIVTL